MVRYTRRLAVALSFVALSAQAGEGVINFDYLAGRDLPGGIAGNGYTYFDATIGAEVGGFVFKSNRVQWMISPSYGQPGDAGMYPYNGTDVWMGLGTMWFTRANRAPFSVSSLDLKDWHGDGYPQSVTLKAYRMDGSVATRVIALDTSSNAAMRDGNDYTTYALSGFDNLEIFNLDFSPNSYVAVDNIAFTASAVPEPGVPVMLALGGLVVLGLEGRRRRGSC